MNSDMHIFEEISTCFHIFISIMEKYFELCFAKNIEKYLQSWKGRKVPSSSKQVNWVFAKAHKLLFLQKPTQLLLPTNEFLTELCRQTKMHLDKLDKTVDLKKTSLFIVKCKSHLMFFTKTNVAWNIIHSSWFGKQIRFGSHIPRMPPRLAPPISRFLQISSWTRIEFQKTLKVWRSEGGTPLQS